MASYLAKQLQAAPVPLTLMKSQYPERISDDDSYANWGAKLELTLMGIMKFPRLVAISPKQKPEKKEERPKG
ncbi:hypothetical protein [Lucifera butyrica]|uniref:hypothetical protein n=1 Tax=Lucifera butyrica TaxID=1351585 RepID=UPI0014021C80|nr:hypothetical protein [Lucifera butyrica]